MSAKRITQRIPDSQRKRPRMQLSLDPRAHALLKSMENASDYVSWLILRDHTRKQSK